MKLMTSNFNQPQFMAHTYKIRPKSYEVEVRTDNEPYLGEEPYLVPLSKHCYFDNIKMDKENGVYSAKILEDKIIKYHIDKDIYQPHVFSYDKATGELSYNSIQMMDEGVTFNEDGEIIDIDPIEEDLSNNEKIMEQIKK